MRLATVGIERAGVVCPCATSHLGYDALRLLVPEIYVRRRAGGPFNSSRQY